MRQKGCEKKIVLRSTLVLDGKFNLCSDGATLRVSPALKTLAVFELPLQHDFR